MSADPDIQRLLASYPRQRPPLDPGQAAIYEREYKRNRSGGDVASSMAQRLERWMHRQIARGGAGGPVLELGAGTLNHLPHESPEVLACGYDVVEPQAHLYRDSPRLASVRDVFGDLGDVPRERRYGRIISVAVLEHLPDLPTALARCGLLLDEAGLMQHGIPSEGGLLWGLAWRTTTGLSYRLRTGFSYGRLMRHEHLSQAWEIEALVRHFFAQVQRRRFPLPGRHLSFYTYLECSQPLRERCAHLLAGAGGGGGGAEI